MPQEPTTSRLTVEEPRPTEPELLETSTFVGRSVSSSVGLPRLPGYELLHELGRGGMGVVYLARQQGLNRLVALKMIRSGELAGPQDRERFLAEAEAIARLQHPGIVQIHEIGTYDDQPFFALEYAEGGSLAARLAGEPLPPREAAQLVELLSRAMQHAHERGIIHRDLKPANILLSGEGRGARGERREESSSPRSPLDTHHSSLLPKITDFGIAKVLDRDGGATATGAIMGTPSYASPEQASGQAREVTAASDIHALGVILYEVLTGRPPFRGASALQTLEMIRSREPVAPGQLQPGLPRDLETICLKCLQKEPQRRYASAGELADDLRRFLDGIPIRARPVGAIERAVKWARRRPAQAALVAVLLAALLAGGVGVGIYQRDLGKALQTAIDEKNEADLQRTRAVQERQEADRAREKAREEGERARDELFTLQLHQAAELVQKDPSRAQTILDECAPELRNFAWGYLRRHSRRCVVRFKAHRGAVTGAVLTRDETTLLTAGNDACVRVWDARTGASLGSLPGCEKAVHSLALSPNGETLVAGCADGQLLAWDMGSRRLRHTIVLGRSPVVSVSFKHDNRTLICGTVGHGVFLADVVEGKGQGQLLGEQVSPVVAAWSPQGDRMAAGCNFPRQTLLLEMPSRRQRVIEERPLQVSGVAFSPDGTLLASQDCHHLVTQPSDVRLWDLSANRLLASFRTASPLFNGIAFSADGETLSFPGFENTVRLIDVRSRQERLILRDHPSRVETIALGPSGQTLVAGTRDGTVVVWDLRTEREAPPLEKTTHRYGSVVFMPGGEELVLGGFRHVIGQAPRSHVNFIDWASGRSRLWPDDDGMVYQVAVASQGLLALSLETGTHLLGPRGEVLRKLPERGGGWRLGFSPDGARLAGVGTGSRVKVWDVQTGQEVCQHADDRNLHWQGVVFTRDGRSLIAGGGGSQGPGELRRCDAATGKPQLRVKAHQARINQLALSPNRRILATAGWDRTVCLWNPDDLERPPIILRDHTSKVEALAFSPDSRILATAGEDQLIRLWDASRGRLQATLPGHQGAVLGLAFHPEGKALVSVGMDGLVRVWLAE